MGICPKVIIIARPEFELTYYDSQGQHFNHYTTRTPPHNNDLVWMGSTRPSISNSSSLFTKPLGIVPSAPITIDITVNFMLYIFLVL